MTVLDALARTWSGIHGDEPWGRLDLRLTDTCPRDGSHHKRHQLTATECHDIVEALDAAGVPVIEVTHGDGLGGSSFNDGFSRTREQELRRQHHHRGARGRDADRRLGPPLRGRRGQHAVEALIGVCDKLGGETGVDFLRIVDASEDVVRPAMPEECQLDRMTLMMGYAGVYSSFLEHAGNAAERYGSQARRSCSRPVAAS